MKRFWQIANILALIFALVANFLVSTQQLDVPSIRDISDKYATFLTPATYAFSIWSLIYLLLIGLAVYQARDLIRPIKTNTLPTDIGPYFVIASILNGLWTYLFVKDLVGISVIVLLSLTALLYILLFRLGIAMRQPPFKVLLFVWWPLMLYTGWVTIAAVVNIATWGNSIGVIIGPVVACLVLIAIGVVLLLLLLRRNMRELLFASTWGIAAIGVNQAGSGGNTLVASTAYSVSAVLLIAVIIHALKNMNSVISHAKVES